MAAAEGGAFGMPWQSGHAEEILTMRAPARGETSRPNRDLKRGPGGLMDVEFVVQLLKIKHGRAHPGVRATNTRESLDAARAVAGLLAPGEAEDCAPPTTSVVAGPGPSSYRPQPFDRRSTERWR